MFENIDSIRGMISSGAYLTEALPLSDAWSYTRVLRVRVVVDSQRLTRRIVGKGRR
ncbi:MAG: hypothetical protein ACLUDU_07390 [Butyricimonas faecihominis]